MIDITRNCTVLDNGITVLSEHAPYFNRTALGINLMAGSVHENAEQAGIAHLVEHLLFRGTRSRSGAEIQDAIEDMGGGINGRTQVDQTMYTATVVNEDVGKAMHLFANMMMDPLMDPEDIALEKQIIEDENCRGCFNCSMNEAFFETAFPDQSLGRPVIGYEDTIKAITREQLVAFHRDFYVGRNMTVAVCGDMTHDQVVDLVTSAFADLPAGEASTLPQMAYAGGDMHMGTGSDDSSVWLGFDITDFSLDEKRAIWMFSDMMAGHGQSRLMTELREKRGLVYGVSSVMETYARRDILRLYLNGPSPKIAEICEITCDTLRAAADAIEENEHQKALRRNHLNSTMAQDELEGRVFDMLTDISESDHVTDPAERYSAYQTMSRHDIQTAAQKMLAARPVIVMSAPVRFAPKFPALLERLGGEKKVGRLSGFFKRTG